MYLFSWHWQMRYVCLANGFINSIWNRFLQTRFQFFCSLKKCNQKDVRLFHQTQNIKSVMKYCNQQKLNFLSRIVEWNHFFPGLRRSWRLEVLSSVEQKWEGESWSWTRTSNQLLQFPIFKAFFFKFQVLHLSRSWKPEARSWKFWYFWIKMGC